MTRSEQAPHSSLRSELVSAAALEDRTGLRHTDIQLADDDGLLSLRELSGEESEEGFGRRADLRVFVAAADVLADKIERLESRIVGGEPVDGRPVMGFSKCAYIIIFRRHGNDCSGGQE